MNRERKYRAWDKKRKRMYEALHLHLSSEGIWATVKGFDIIEQKDIHLQIQPKDIEIMDFTGLQDRKDQRIYEGDILTGWKKGSNSDRGYTGFVEWNTPQCGFVIRCDKYLMEILSLAMSGDGETTRLDSFEVIGNIYSNPELLNPAK